MEPLISCLCVSSGRPRHLEKAIKYFISQTYPNRELIVISEHVSEEYNLIVQSFHDTRIKYYSLDKPYKVSQGELRNFSLEKANGAFFCNWDDDDWYHCRRLEIQFAAALKMRKAGSVLPYCLLYDAINKNAYLSAPFVPPGSVLCKKSVLNNTIQHPHINKQEDFDFLKQLFSANLLYPLVNPVLYIYVYHGLNTTNELFAQQFKDGYALSGETSELIGQVVNSEYSPEISSDLLDHSVLVEMNYFHNYGN